jgi:VanZ family protein
MRRSTTPAITGNFILSSIWAIIILVACVIPVNKVHRTFLSNIKHVDKYFHFVMYLVFSIVLYIDFTKYKHTLKNRYITWIFLSLITLSWGTIIELVQYFFLANRTGSINDVMADAGGTITGIILILTLRKYILKP